MRTVGKNPAAAEAQGINVLVVRICAVLAGIVLVVFGSWRPGKALLGAIHFGLFDAYRLRLQQLAGAVVAGQLFLMLPFILSIIALIVMSRRVAYPDALRVPYRKGER